MANCQHVLVNFRGHEGYGLFLDELTAEARRRGIDAGSRSGVLELACNELAEKWGITPPIRSRAWGKLKVEKEKPEVAEK